MSISPSQQWHRSSYCSSGTCVEANFSVPGEVLIRDSKIKDGAILQFSAASWRSFAAGIRAGEFRAEDAVH